MCVDRSSHKIGDPPDRVPPKDDPPKTVSVPLLTPPPVHEVSLLPKPPGISRLWREVCG